MLQNSSYSEVADFNITVRSKKNVLSFKISMEDLFIVNIIHGESHLHEPSNNLMLGEQSS